MNKLFFRWFIFCLFFSSRIYALSPEDTKRFNTLTNETRCVVCQNQSIADSNAPLAHDLREKIYRMIVEKKTDAEIKKYLVSRYGEFILLRPSINKLTIALWAFPFVAVVFIFIFLLTFSRSKCRPRRS